MVGHACWCGGTFTSPEEELRAGDSSLGVCGLLPGVLSTFSGLISTFSGTLSTFSGMLCESCPT
jgi:hypothetical protein